MYVMNIMFNSLIFSAYLIIRKFMEYLLSIIALRGMRNVRPI